MHQIGYFIFILACYYSANFDNSYLFAAILI